MDLFIASTIESSERPSSGLPPVQKRMRSLRIVHGEDQAARVTREEKYRQQDIPLARSARMIGENEESLFRRYQVFSQARSYFALRTPDHLMAFLCTNTFSIVFPTQAVYPRERSPNNRTAINR